MIALTAALDGACTIWTQDGGERRVPAIEFVLGPQQNALRPGELLRAIDLPADALRRTTAFRQISLSPLGRSAALLIGSLSPPDGFALTVTAATRRPVRIDFPTMPSDAELRRALDQAIPDTLYYDDIHGAPDWRRHMTYRFSGQILRELSDPVPS
jgi:CO/xanthine dehydrogenase FAD-binding subunit